ncbi:MAG: GDSL family lipase, partial [Lachnospiraceae bacterium]|nr:GDSL family lipase [Lachnospiraceae bacterium]
MATIFWAGDSTVQYNGIMTYPQTGIGQVLHLFLKPEVKVENHAKNGRSTKSFIDESRLPAIYDKISEGDFFFIQFGHNDEKKEDPDRYTEPFSDYMVNL